MGLPELIQVVPGKTCEVRIAQVCLYKGRTSRIHHEEHDGEGEPVGDHRLVGAASEELRGHVLNRAHKPVAEVKAIFTLNRACESKVRNFQVEVWIEQDVLKFEVSVRDALPVHVSDAFDKLPGVVLDDGHGKSTLADEVREKLALGQELGSDITNPDLFISNSELCIDRWVYLFHNVLVVELSVLASLIAEDVAVVAEDFEGDLWVIDGARGFSDFASAAFSEYLSDLVIIDHWSLFYFVFYFNYYTSPLVFKGNKLYGNQQPYAYIELPN